MSAKLPVRSRPGRAIVPAAGFGTRLRPLTNALPKEMLPIGRKPVLEYVVEELCQAGISRVLFIISPGKEIIRRYFGDGSAWGLTCEYALQTEMRGLGDAVLQGETWTEGQPFVVAFGDCLIESRVESRESREPLIPLARMIETHISNVAGATVLTERVARERTRKYGILAPLAPLPEPPEAPFSFHSLIEKPRPEEAPSLQAIAARWIFEPTIFDYLHHAVPDERGEIYLTESVREMLDAGSSGWAVPLLPAEARRDIGGWDTYFAASLRAALADEEYGAHLRKLLCGEVDRS